MMMTRIGMINDDESLQQENARSFWLGRKSIRQMGQRLSKAHNVKYFWNRLDNRHGQNCDWFICGFCRVAGGQIEVDQIFLACLGRGFFLCDENEHANFSLAICYRYSQWAQKRINWKNQSQRWCRFWCKEGIFNGRRTKSVSKNGGKA